MRESKWNLYMDGMQSHPSQCHSTMCALDLSFIKDLIPPSTHKKILDIGAGDGKESLILRDMGYDVTGIVRGDLNYNYAMGKYPGIEFLNCDMHDLPFPRNSFDAIYMNQVFEHLFSPFMFLLECFCVLRDGGLFYSRTPKFEERVTPNNVGLLDAQYISHHHPNVMPANVYRQMFEKTGFEIVIQNDNETSFLVRKGTIKNLHGDLHEIISRRDLV